jgi:hypothetical protein
VKWVHRATQSPSRWPQAAPESGALISEVVRRLRRQVRKVRAPGDGCGADTESGLASAGTRRHAVGHLSTLSRRHNRDILGSNPTALRGTKTTTTMPISSPWRDFELRFRSLQGQYGDSLHASWWPASKLHGGKWQLFGSTNLNELDQFKSLAEQAAIALGHPPGARAVGAWLDVLKAYSPSYSVVALESESGGGSTSPTMAGRIDRLHKASADQCIRLNAKTIEVLKPPPGLNSMSRWLSYLAEWAFQQRQGKPYSFEQFLLEESQQRFLREMKPRTEEPPAPEPELSNSDAFATEEQRESAIVAYITLWRCTREDLARTAKVHYTDLNKWKRIRNLAKKDLSQKTERIEDILNRNQPPSGKT